MRIYTEITPNPASLKFVLDQIILNGGAADFPTAETAETGSKLASKLFMYPFTNGVFLGRNFVTVSKSEDTRWEDIIPVVKDEISGFINSGEKIVENEEMLVAIQSDDELTNRIIQVIEDQVRPAVAMDGGDIIFQGFEDGVVKLQLRGSCSGCPSSSATLKQGIQALMIRLFPNDVKAVEAV
jgi:NFU1 iron-sulfur cluster scaffold homolog, mitochondrial